MAMSALSQEYNVRWEGQERPFKLVVGPSIIEITALDETSLPTWQEVKDAISDLVTEWINATVWGYYPVPSNDKYHRYIQEDGQVFIECAYLLDESGYLRRNLLFSRNSEGTISSFTVDSCDLLPLLVYERELEVVPRRDKSIFSRVYHVDRTHASEDTARLEVCDEASFSYEVTWHEIEVANLSRRFKDERGWFKPNEFQTTRFLGIERPSVIIEL